MLAATLIGVFFTPLFYWLVMTLFGRGRKHASPVAAAAVPGDDGNRAGPHGTPQAAPQAQGATP
jgi:hypothetical protein